MRSVKPPDGRAPVAPRAVLVSAIPARPARRSPLEARCASTVGAADGASAPRARAALRPTCNHRIHGDIGEPLREEGAPVPPIRASASIRGGVEGHRRSPVGSARPPIGTEADRLRLCRPARSPIPLVCAPLATFARMSRHHGLPPVLAAGACAPPPPRRSAVCRLLPAPLGSPACSPPGRSGASGGRVGAAIPSRPRRRTAGGLFPRSRSALPCDPGEASRQ